MFSNNFGIILQTDLVRPFNTFQFNRGDHGTRGLCSREGEKQLLSLSSETILTLSDSGFGGGLSASSSRRMTRWLTWT